MKNILIIFFAIFLLGDCALCFTSYNPTRTYRNTYNPYNNPLSYSRNQNKNRIKKMQQRRKLNRTRRIYNSINSTLNNTRYNPGTLTGYSVPVNQSIFSRFGSNNVFNNRHQLNSPTCNQDLFSDGSSGETYYNNGEYFNHTRNTGAKTGVTIIYD